MGDRTFFEPGIGVDGARACAVLLALACLGGACNVARAEAQRVADNALSVSVPIGWNVKRHSEEILLDDDEHKAYLDFDVITIASFPSDPGAPGDLRRATKSSLEAARVRRLRIGPVHAQLLEARRG